MLVALIGASGQLGTDLQKIIPTRSLIKLDYPDFDITKKNIVESGLSSFKPDIVINTAAYNLVDRAEDYPEEAMAVNFYGVTHLSASCLKLNIPLVHYSTDYVFGADSKRNHPYTEEDIPGPINQYGRSKLKAEQFITQKMKQYFIIRTAYLFGTAGSKAKGGNIIESMINIGRQQGELRAATNQFINPTYTLDLAKQTLNIIQTQHYGLFHAVSRGNCTPYKLATEIFNCLGKKINIIPVKADYFKPKAGRPLYSVLENKKLNQLKINIMPSWPQSLRHYLKEKKYIN